MLIIVWQYAIVGCVLPLMKVCLEVYKSVTTLIQALKPSLTLPGAKVKTLELLKLYRYTLYEPAAGRIVSHVICVYGLFYTLDIYAGSSPAFYTTII